MKLNHSEAPHARHQACKEPKEDEVNRLSHISSHFFAFHSRLPATAPFAPMSRARHVLKSTKMRTTSAMMAMTTRQTVGASL